MITQEEGSPLISVTQFTRFHGQQRSFFDNHNMDKIGLKYLKGA